MATDPQSTTSPLMSFETESLTAKRTSDGGVWLRSSDGTAMQLGPADAEMLWLMLSEKLPRQRNRPPQDLWPRIRKQIAGAPAQTLTAYDLCERLRVRRSIMNSELQDLKQRGLITETAIQRRNRTVIVIGLARHS